MKQSSGHILYKYVPETFLFEQKKTDGNRNGSPAALRVYWLSGQGARLASETLGKKETVVVLDPGHGRRRVRRGGRL